ncbi:MAG TPA: polymer-forming cytoskeletal protein [Woeseiaceae bacterium]
MRDRTTGPATLISEGCKVTGVLSGQGDFMISGTVEGDCDLNGAVSITRQGIWNGTLKADSVVIAGTVEGDIEARGRVEITDSARINGTVTAEAIAVAEGAVVQGVMRTTGHSRPTEFVEKRRPEQDAGDERQDWSAE